MATPITSPKFYDLEQEIMKCWQVTEDINTLYMNVMNSPDNGGLDSDEIANFLLGIVTIYNMKFNHLFSLYEGVVKAQAGR